MCVNENICYCYKNVIVDDNNNNNHMILATHCSPDASVYSSLSPHETQCRTGN